MSTVSTGSTGSSMSLLGSIVSGAGSLLGSVFGGLFGNYQQNKANEYNKQMLAQQYEYNKLLAEQEYERNIQQWMRENEYNSPVSQLARLTEAGINPHLAYSKGSINNVASSSPQYQSPTYGYAPFENADISSYIRSGAESMSALIREGLGNSNLRAQNEYIKAQTAMALASASEHSTNARIRGIYERYAERMFSAQTTNEEKKTEQLEWSINNAVQTYEGQRLSNEFNARTVDKRVEQLDNAIRESFARIGLTKTQTLNTQANTANTLWRLENIGPLEVEKLRKEIDKIFRDRGYSGEIGNVFTFINGLFETIGLDIRI